MFIGLIFNNTTIFMHYIKKMKPPSNKKNKLKHTKAFWFIFQIKHLSAHFQSKSGNSSKLPLYQPVQMHAQCCSCRR